MNISEKGVALIKSFEGLCLKACKAIPSEPYYTIGYGHYGADVSPNMTITQAQAEKLLKQDLSIFERAVETNVPFPINQNQFDALVSFTYNCGTGSLKTLVNNRTPDIVAEKILLYDKANGQTLPGLTRRRQAERKLFLTEEGLSVTQYEELKLMITSLSNDIKELKNPMIYNYIDKNMPEWARPTIQKLMDKGLLKGTENGLNLTEDLMRVLVINDRAGIYN